jgi:hypothetical protein
MILLCAAARDGKWLGWAVIKWQLAISLSSYVIRLLWTWRGHMARKLLRGGKVRVELPASAWQRILCRDASTRPQSQGSSGLAQHDNGMKDCFRGHK